MSWVRDQSVPCVGKKKVVKFHEKNIYISRNEWILIPFFDDSTYKNVEDVDLFTGGLAEVPTKGAVVGPTFACLLGRQMYYYKTGKCHFTKFLFFKKRINYVISFYFHFSLKIRWSVLVWEWYPTFLLHAWTTQRNPQSQLGSNHLWKHSQHR